MDEKAGQETVRLINEAVGKKDAAVFEKVDVSKSDDCKRMVDRAEKTFGKLTTLFNNAGIMMNDDDDAVNTSEAVWDKTMAVNVKGVFFGCKHAIPAMKRAGGGSIVNTASFVSIIGAATPQLAYTASKGAVLSMTRELAVIHARQGIRVNALCPGPLNTPLLQKFLDSDAKKQRRLVHVPMGRFGMAEEMAQAALFLASNDASYMTGASFVVDGGITAAYVTPEEKVDPFGVPPHLKKN
jgi:NAD(P)-dependent dehydrogenase (short-subunit alcohol dehydrogenase family)